MLTKGMTKRLELPHEPGQWIEVRELSFMAIRRAKEKAMLDQSRFLKELKPFLDDDVEERATEAASKARKRDPLLDYDLGVLMQEAVIAWSYDDKVTRESVLWLDQRTAEYVARAVIPAPETEDERKNG